MKSKRSPLLVVTDDSISVNMNFFSDGTKATIITCKGKDIVELVKQYQKIIKKRSKKFKDHLQFVHLNPDISFLLT